METSPHLETGHAAVVVDAAGIRAAVPVELRELVVARSFFWVDIFDGAEAPRTDFLNHLGLETDDITWAQRFGQTGRMLVGRQKLRAVTWAVSETLDILEVHLVSYKHFIVTLRNGDSGAIDDVRERFSTRIGYLDQSHYQAAGILLQLLLSTVDLAIDGLDSELVNIQNHLSRGASFLDDSALVTWRDKWQSRWTRFERYSSVVRSAVVGIEVVQGMDERGAAELNDYADQVDDVEHRLYERSLLLENVMRDYNASIAEHQTKQISRLTVVSMIFLPLTFLTGVFGMNFNWMIKNISSESAFVVLGLILPALSAFISLALFMRRGLLFVKRPRQVPLQPRRDLLPGPPFAEK
jgi:Mg2+ and Co2+ transporter CorA